MTPMMMLLLALVTNSFWPIVGASGTKHFSGVLFIQAGLFIGLAVLTPWLLLQGRWKRLFCLQTAPFLAGMGLLSGTATAIYINALAYTTPANAAIMAQSEVVYSVLLCSFFLKESPSWRQLTATALVLAGTGLIMARDLDSLRWKGDLMIVATPWMFQCSHILSKRLSGSLDPFMIAGGRVFYGLLAMLPWSLWQLAHQPHWSWQPQALAVLLAQGVGMSSLNLLFWYKAIASMDLAKATTVLLSYPALTTLFSWLLGRESIGSHQLAGLVLTFSGAYWVSRLVLQNPSETK